MAKKKQTHPEAKLKKRPKRRSKPLPGVALEKLVAQIQQMFDPNCQVTHNEKIVDRVGNERQFDVVVRGTLSGYSILGVIECKDHGRKKGVDAVEAFAKKTEHIRAGLRLIVSRWGFTEPALKLARHEGIGTLSLLPLDVKASGPKIFSTWYAELHFWESFEITVKHHPNDGSLDGVPLDGVEYQGKKLVDWFYAQLERHHKDAKPGSVVTRFLRFPEPVPIEIGGTMCQVVGVDFRAERTAKTKMRRVQITGTGFYDWQAQELRVPAEGVLGGQTSTDFINWDDYAGPRLPRKDFFEVWLVLSMRQFEKLDPPQLDQFVTLEPVPLSNKVR